MARARRGRSEGSIYFRESDHRWVACISSGYDGSGRRKRRNIYGASKVEVQDKLRQLQNRPHRDPMMNVGSMKLGDYLNRWLENTVKPGFKHTTYNRYESMVRTHLAPRIGAYSLAKLTRFHVEDFYAMLAREGISASTQRMAGRVLTTALNQAVESELIPVNPAAKVKKARPARREMQVFTAEQARLYLEATEAYRLHALFVVALGSGLRQGELLALDWSDIDFDRGTVTVKRTVWRNVVSEPKSAQSRRTIVLPLSTLDALRGHRAKMLAEGNIKAPVFCTKSGRYASGAHVRAKMHAPAIRRANRLQAEVDGTALLPEIRFHDLRHTHACLLLAGGASVKAVSQRLGHESIEITLNHYAHVLPNDDAKLAEGIENMLRRRLAT
jgi:integrase